ncbi:MAG: glutamine-synthetase adenylyltransferase [Acidobacteria bacterium]|nr:glutamine-synthetase adenylyltransferase [Acidobacteriota bacterium]
MSPPSELLAGIALRQPHRARADLKGIAGLLPPKDVEILAQLLRQSPDPDAALHRLERFLRLDDHAVHALRGSPRRLHAAITVFAFSNFLSDALDKRPELLAWALDPIRFYRGLSADEMRSDLAWIDPALDDAKAALVLARFRRMQLLRIGLRDLLGVAELGAVTLELSNLADALLQGAHDHIRAQLVRRFGRPLLRAGEADIEGGFVVLALGKLGGRELNYSSDIDLMYLHTGDGVTAGPVPIPNHDFYQQLATRLTKMLSLMTADGFCYRVDLRLRPEGAAGDLVTSLDAAVAYYNQRARDWELQMLIKARPAAGERRLGATLLQMVRPLIYRTTTDFSLIERVSESRDRIQQQRRRSNRDRAGRSRPVDVKLERGGIRDIEFLVQCLQRLHGGKDPFVRSGSTLFALHRLHEKNHISSSDYAALSSAYHFLRTCEHRLQMLDNRQTHELPRNGDQLRLLERRLQGVSYGPAEPEALPAQLQEHFRTVAAIYERIIRSQSAETELEPAVESATAPSPADELEQSWRPQLRQIELSHPVLAAALAALPIERGARVFAHLLETLVGRPDLLDLLAKSPELVALAGDLVECSPFLAEHLLRYPDDLTELANLVARRPTPEDESDPPNVALLDTLPEAAPLRDRSLSYVDKSMLLRRVYRRRMLAILADSIHYGRPVFTTLAQTSDLAEWVVQRAYSIAMEATLAERGRAEPPSPMLQVVALGRLGMREFDLGSDADLIFVLPDGAPNRRFWNVFAGKLIEVISSYTAEGRIFSVDARLRPRGRDGELVQAESAYLTYFREHAEAWEALSYMKARTVAGDFEAGRRFLERLQTIGWERFGQSEDLAGLLRGMRARLEREQGRPNPLKAGVGGYYDIDFILLYLRLRNAGVFFEYLSTPQRIEIVRAYGSLSDEQAAQLRRAAVFFRAVDHAIRASTGHSSATLPASLALQETICELLGRWSAVQPSSQPLAAVVEGVRSGSRALFRQILGD